MKATIHPTYHAKAQVSCNCGMTFEVGSTKEAIKVEVCSNCHPFYTGRSLLIDAAGRVDKFEARRKKAAELEQQSGKKSKKTVEQSESKDATNDLKELRKHLLKAE
ncbi:50S ribosomal protein L31 [Candidatus Berkelbacteria bacterium]|nr:50S ribosomal protein L31 [Candidatus Berkelbacteria bacterium]